MKTNIRLFVPNTTEALDFEYGLVIHYMSYNDYRAQSEIGLQYYELAEIDPIDNALDIVQQKVITDAARSQSKIDGFTLDSHYTLSFGERLNNKIAEDSVRQVWLWLHCKNTMEYPFLLEKVTDTDQKTVSEQNQLLVRLWVHPEWQEREIDPLAQAKINNRLELISVMKQALSAQFDQIEQANRQKVLAELKLKTISPPPPTILAPPALPDSLSAAPQAEYKPKPIIQKSTAHIQPSIKYAVLLAETQHPIYTIEQAEFRICVIKAEIEKIKQDMHTIDDEFIEISSACVKHVQDCIKKIISARKHAAANTTEGENFGSLVKTSVTLLEQLARFDLHDDVRRDLAQSIVDIQKMQPATGLETVAENLSPVLNSSKPPVEQKQENFEENIGVTIAKIFKIYFAMAMAMAFIASVTGFVTEFESGIIVAKLAMVMLVLGLVAWFVTLVVLAVFFD